MKVIYIAGPFSAGSDWERHRNVLRAEEASAEVTRLGAVPLCPHKSTEHLSGIQDEDFWYAATLELLRRCDAVFLVERWTESRGARGEYEEAGRLGIPRFSTLAALAEWLQTERQPSTDDDLHARVLEAVSQLRSLETNVAPVTREALEGIRTQLEVNLMVACGYSRRLPLALLHPFR